MSNILRYSINPEDIHLLISVVCSAAQYHPDKITSNEVRQNADAYFVHLKLASDTLLSPVKRFAYDRFGPGILEWRQCSSFQDYILRGFQVLAPYYFGGIIFLFALSVLGYLDGGSYVQSPPSFANAPRCLTSVKPSGGICPPYLFSLSKCTQFLGRTSRHSPQNS